MTKRLNLKTILAVSVSLAIPMTYNACGKFESAHFEYQSSSLSSPIQFDRLSVPESAKSGFTVRGTCSKNLSPSITVDTLAAVILDCSSGSFSHNVVLPGVDGPKNILLSVMGVDGREYRDSLTVIKDTALPVLSIINVVPQNNYVVISGTCETGLPIAHGGNIQSISANNCAQGIFQISALLSAVSGPKVLQLTQTDKAGNVGSAAYEWNPDTTLPVLTVSAPVANAFVGANSTVAGSCEVGLAVSISGTALASAQQVNCTSGTYSLNFAVNAADGAKTLIVSQTDASSNKAEVVVNITKDTMAPNVTIAAPAAGATVTTGSITVSGACENGLPVVIQGSGVSAMVQLNCAGAAYSSSVTLTSGNGQKLIEVSQSDNAGNTTKVSRTISSTAPSSLLTILQPAANSFSKGAITLSGACDNGSTLAFSGGISSATNSTCSGGTYSKALTLSAGDGLKTVTVTQTLSGVNSVASRSFNKDSTAPSVTIAQPAASALVEGNFIVSGSCETGLPVVLSGAGLTASVNATCANGSYSSTVTSTTGDGNKVFSATQTDAATNTASMSRTVVRDTSVPVLTFVSPANNSVVGAMATLAGACETGLPVNLSGTGLSQATSATCSAGMFSQVVTLSNGDGSKSLTAKQTDLAGNVATVNLTLMKDTVAPNLTITAPAVGTKAEAGLTITGACENGFNVKAFGTGVSSEVTKLCASQAYSLAVTFSSGDGIKTIQISQADTAGNTTTVSRQFEKAAAPGALFTAAKSVISNYCLSCHKAGGSAASTDFNLANETDFVTRGFVVPKKPDESKMIYRLVHYNGATQLGARNMPLGYTTSSFPSSAYTTLVNWVNSLQDSSGGGTEIPVGFTCTDPSLKQKSLSYTLTKNQYKNAIRDLFGAAMLTTIDDELSVLPEDVFDATSNKRGNTLTLTVVQAYYDTAKIVAADITANNTKITNVFGSCATAASPAATCIDTYLGGFARKIYRRALTTDEITFAKSIANRGGTYKDNLKALLSYHLQSPAFIWRVELGSSISGTTITLTPYEVASRIAFQTTDSIPDDTLLAAAAANQLTTVAQVQAQARRLLATASGREHVKKNLLRWSMNDKAISFASLPADLYSGLNINGLGDAMVDEAGRYVDYMVFSQNASFKTLLTSNVSLATNSSLAQIYGHSPAASGGTAVMTGRRQGLLMRSAFLSSPRTRTSIIKRGVDFQKRVLCNEIPSPTSSIVDQRTDNELSDAEKLQYSNRDSIAHQTQAAVCMTCHGVINPTGFALEMMDPFGRIRTSEKVYNASNQLVTSYPVNASTEVPLPTGAKLPVQDAYDLVSYIATSSEGSACFARNAFRYLNERREVAADDCQLNKVHTILKDQSKSVLDAMVELVGNDNLFTKKN